MLTEKYRPRNWDEMCAQDRAVRLLQARETAGTLGGHAYFVTGPSGFGKTTLARIIAEKLSNQFYIREMDAGELRAPLIAEIKEDQWYVPMGAQSRVYIVNESHGLRKDVIRSLLVLLEELRPYTTFIFTSTIDGQTEFFEDNIDAKPLIDRCISVRLAQRNICKAAAAHVKNIAELEGLDGQPIEKYERLLKDNGNSIRAALQAVESGAMCAGEERGEQ